MIIVLNGPLGIGKSTLAEALTESIEFCAMLEGDRLVAVNPPSTHELDHLHSAIELLVTLVPAGEGRVGVFAEAAMFSAQVRGQLVMGMNAPEGRDNPRFLLNVVAWLIED